MRAVTTRPWLAAAVLSLLVMPVGIAASVGADQECNHLTGDIQVAVSGTPRASWCDAVQSHSHWLLLIIVPALASLALGVAVGRRSWLYLPAWSVGAALAVSPVVYLSSLRAYPLI